MSQPTPSITSQAPIVSESKIPLIVYILYIASYFTGGLTALIGVILAHLNAKDRDELMRSHYNYQIRTFWWGLLWTFIGVALAFFVIGYFVLLAWMVWSIYRIVKGLNALNKNQPVY